eukprot:2284685-Rhodomonas_salina.1
MQGEEHGVTRGGMEGSPGRRTHASCSSGTNGCTCLAGQLGALLPICRMAFFVLDMAAKWSGDDDLGLGPGSHLPAYAHATPCA